MARPGHWRQRARRAPHGRAERAYDERSVRICCGLHRGRLPAGDGARIRPFLGGAPPRLQGAALFGRLRQDAVEPCGGRRPAPSTSLLRCRSAATSRCSTSVKAPVRPGGAAPRLQSPAALAAHLRTARRSGLQHHVCGAGADRHAADVRRRAGAPDAGRRRRRFDRRPRRPARRRRDQRHQWRAGQFASAMCCSACSMPSATARRSS